MKEPRWAKDYWSYAKYANLAFSLGITLGVSIFLGFWAGQWLDRRLGTQPWLMVLGVLLGVAVGFYSIVKEIGILGDGKEERPGGRQGPKS
ncbi:Putative F0F1-ATPase subunit Ca2+/Mg2+ transporter [Thermanaeromonas toyohensis ToBE]|uniref:Putative F0F1-ATPase subunit Ca2+/Mg2+ transporter n=1 Tax=Thermanaeromonas toyohensis ToBE TaxID=698762 RepID=A0A1W1W3M0_9FIRM|nr:AtpZ/AtpI family protein [Thermanaeromonas toyohensis]SMC00093.1 Putative F0F1-ATPase subunit Ca2+/Mg2+ transporter [Thermanaeromonas toyohensis ToBE]